MALTVIIIATFIFPVVVLIMIYMWSRAVRTRVRQDQEEQDQLVEVLEKILASKDSVIRKLKEKLHL
jgi:hypothetical protein